MRSLSVYRFWCDLGYAIGALSSGIITDLFGAAWTIITFGVLTVVSGALTAFTMLESRSQRKLDGAEDMWWRQAVEAYAAGAR